MSDKAYTFNERELALYTEWVRENGNLYRGNLQKNGIELYEEYLKDRDRFIKSKSF